MFNKLIVSTSPSSDFLRNTIDSLQSISFAIPDPVFQGLSILTHYVGYFFPLKLYSPIIVLVLGMTFISICLRVITKVVELGKTVFTFFSFTKGK